ncbi:MAG: FtsW/RodA/SpoVE family cell cycle protein [Chitinophagales bacterium]|nr:FtsW/RodA/SpoVE family cell cycle protein [Bacteroidota bacterium]
MKIFNLRIGGDSWIWSIALILSISSLLLIFSSTEALSYRYQDGNTLYYLNRQFIFLLIGWALMIWVHRWNYNLFAYLSRVFIWLAIIILPLTLLWGVNENAASRRLMLPLIGVTFQPSDFAKVALIMYLARSISKYQHSIMRQSTVSHLREFLNMAGPVIAVCLLIVPENLSTAIIVFITSLILMFIGKVYYKYILSLLGLSVLGALFLVGSLYLLPENMLMNRMLTWKHRIDNFYQPTDGPADQTVEAMVAIVEGGFLGSMPGNNVQVKFLTHAYSDFIYTVVLSEYGIWGGIAVILLYLTLIIRTLIIFRQSPGAFGALLAVGLSLSIGIQAFFHMAVNVNLVPVTGIPLPMMTMGGTSIIIACFTLGMILSVSRHIEENKRLKLDT